MNNKLLKSKMALYGDTQRYLASFLQLSEQRLSMKINGIAMFNQREIKIISERYDLKKSEIADIFFDD